MKIKLTVKYNVPSLNVSKRQHWASQMKEKKKAWSALLSALWDTAQGRSTLTTSLAEQKIYSTAYVTLGLSSGMNRGGSFSRLNKSRYRLALKNARRLR